MDPKSTQNQQRSKLGFQSVLSCGPRWCQRPPGCQSGSTKPAKWQIRAPKITSSVPKNARLTSLRAMSNGQGPAAEAVAHEIKQQMVVKNEIRARSKQRPTLLDHLWTRSGPDRARALLDQIATRSGIARRGGCRKGPGRIGKRMQTTLW